MEDPTAQRVRAILCSEPRGHADMYGGFITPPDDEDGDFGVSSHRYGFSTACGHGTTPRVGGRERQNPEAGQRDS
jgi:proline racemase